jgi:predicted acyltransferase
MAHNARWDALDVFRGLTIMLMLLNLSPGSWEFNYGFLVHAPWEGGTLIDMVAPAFLFCIGAALPLSFERRAAKGATAHSLLAHVFWRSLLLVAIGFFLNLYPAFDVDTVRIPGVLQRIGLCYCIVGLFAILTAQRRPQFRLRARPIALGSVVVLLSYWALLYFVPVPGYGAPRFDAVGSWPPFVDRAVIGVEHFFPHWPVDGKVVFDPEGILSTWPACFNVLFGALVGLAFARGSFGLPALTGVVVGGAIMGLALALQGFCPIIKNIWTSTFALFSGGFALLVLALLMPVSQAPGVRSLLAPTRIFGENPLLAYILCFLVAPLIDYPALANGTQSLRTAGQAWFTRYLEPNAASLAFGLVGLLAIFLVLLLCHRKRWILKL